MEYHTEHESDHKVALSSVAAKVEVLKATPWESLRPKFKRLVETNAVWRRRKGVANQSR